MSSIKQVIAATALLLAGQTLATGCFGGQQFGDMPIAEATTAACGWLAKEYNSQNPSLTYCYPSNGNSINFVINWMGSPSSSQTLDSSDCQNTFTDYAKTCDRGGITFFKSLEMTIDPNKGACK